MVDTHLSLYGLLPSNLEEFQPSQVPLTFIKISAFIQSFISEVTILSFYKNTHTQPIECEYIFPLNDDAVITQLLAQFDDGRELTAKIEEKQSAKKKYSSAISSGHSAILARTNEPDKMILSIGNLAPNSKARVTIQYVSPLAVMNEHWKFFIPVAMTPLYSLDSHFDIEDREVTDFPIVQARGCPYSIGFTVKLESPSPIQGLHSINHDVDIDFLNQNKCALVTLSPNSTYVPDRDFILNFYTSDAHKPKAIFETQEDKVIAMLSFIPKFIDEGESEEDIEGTGEYIILLDRSGSMSGDRISIATQAAVLFLKSLPKNSKFNILSFGNSYESMYDRSVDYNSENMNTAINQLNSFKADLGGTEILEPLEYVLNSAPETQYPRTIFLLTDGAVSCPEKVVQLVYKNVGMCRVHTIGIGEGVSTYLIKEVAKAGKGSCSFVTKNEEMHGIVMGALKRAIFPALTQLSINIRGEIVPSPSSIPSVYYNEALVLYAKADEIMGQDASIKCWNTKNSRWEIFSIISDDFYHISGNFIEKLWYKHKIRELELEIDGGNDSIKESVIDLSVRYQIPSKYTAYLAVQENKDPVTGNLTYVKVPISSTADALKPEPFYGLGQVAAFKRTSGTGLRPIGPLKRSRNIGLGKVGGLYRRHYPSYSPQEEESSESSESPKAARKMTKTLPTTSKTERSRSRSSDRTNQPKTSNITKGYMAIISLQEAEGFWKLSSLSAEISVPPILEEIQNLPESDEIWATLVALAYLNKYYHSNKQDWTLVQRKAKKWLKSKGIDDHILKRGIL